MQTVYTQLAQQQQKLIFHQQKEIWATNNGIHHAPSPVLNKNHPIIMNNFKMKPVEVSFSNINYVDPPKKRTQLIIDLNKFV